MTDLMWVSGHIFILFARLHQLQGLDRTLERDLEILSSVTPGLPVDSPAQSTPLSQDSDKGVDCAGLSAGRRASS